MTIERRLTTPDRRDALREKRVELSILLFDSQSDSWLAYGAFPGGSDEFRISSPVGHGKTASEAIDDLLRLKVSVATGIAVSLWALGDAMADLAEGLRRD